MNEQNEYNKLLEHNKNFYSNSKTFKKTAEQNIPFYTALYDLRTQILSALDEENFSDKKQMLKSVFLCIYEFIGASNDKFSIYRNPSPFYEEAFEACFFTSLCMFLNHTTRIKGKGLEAFIKDNSPSYNANDPYAKYSLTCDKDSLRKYRNRLFSQRPVYIQRKEWNGMPADSEYEWTLKYVLEKADETTQDTFKRIGNLYKGFNFEKNKSDTDIDNLRNAYKKFLSKLKKLKFKNYLNLQKLFLTHICKDKTYYGINLYRFEKETRLYITMDEIRSLLECKTDKEEKEFLVKSSILEAIYFPKLYKKFCSISKPDHLYIEIQVFLFFLDCIITSSKLIIDELVEIGYLGDDWNNLFLEIINEMAEKVFYNPDELDFSFPDSPKVQESFEKILAVPIYILLYKLTDGVFD